jgi:arylamine N-acetyltransferase
MTPRIHHELPRLNCPYCTRQIKLCMYNYPRTHNMLQRLANNTRHILRVGLGDCRPTSPMPLSDTRGQSQQHMLHRTGLMLQRLANNTRHILRVGLGDCRPTSLMPLSDTRGQRQQRNLCVPPNPKNWVAAGQPSQSPGPKKTPVQYPWTQKAPRPQKTHTNSLSYI